MPRIARIVIPGCPHHVIQRGNRRLKVFFSDEDKDLYLGLLRRHAEKHGILIWAYCLMDNHVHIVAVPRARDSLARGIGEAHRKFTNLINIRENWNGYLWQGRFISYPMDGGHLFAAVRYIERNPVRARIVSQAEQYRWSSAPAHVFNVKDDILSACPLTADIKDWASYLSRKDDDSEVRKFVEHEHTGPEVPAYLVRPSWPTLGEHGGLRPQKWDQLSRQGKDLIDSGKNLTSFPVQ